MENGFDALGGFLCWFMRDFYRARNGSAPRLYRASYEIVRRVWLFRALGAFILIMLGGRGERRLVQAHSPDLVISTDARLNAVLGYLKRAGQTRRCLCSPPSPIWAAWSSGRTGAWTCTW